MSRLQLVTNAELRSNRTNKGLPDPVIPDSPYAVDVVIPFWAGDSQWLGDCLEAVNAQKHCEPIIHVIADGCEFPVLPNISAEMHRYRHDRPAGQGPYRLTNALVQHGHCRTEHLALQDADDISLCDRLWKQMSLLHLTGAAMISSATENFVQHESLQYRQDDEPVVRPGKIFRTARRGRCVNTTRTMSIEFFRSLNGFQPLLCSGDFEFDNRARYSGLGKVIDDQTILGRRRLHEDSLSHGVAPTNTPQRDNALAVVMRSLKGVASCRKCAPKYGAIKSAFELQVIT